MLYNCIKIFHIVSATLLVSSMAYSFNLWRAIHHRPRINIIISQRIQTQTWLIILPAALAQLASGCTMISMQDQDFSQIWIIASIIGFITLIGAWFSFIYFLLIAQQVASSDPQQSITRFKFFRRAQSMMLLICGGALLAMIFFMANKPA